MDNKQFEFNGTAGGYFLVTIVSIIMAYIPFLGWAFAFNYVTNWMADNALISGKKIKYTSAYGETLVFVAVNMLLVIITFGIYIFWFTPKAYRYICSHTEFVDGAPGVTAQPAVPMAQPPVTSITPTPNTPSNLPA